MCTIILPNDKINENKEKQWSTASPSRLNLNHPLIIEHSPHSRIVASASSSLQPGIISAAQTSLKSISVTCFTSRMALQTYVLLLVISSFAYALFSVKIIGTVFLTHLACPLDHAHRRNTKAMSLVPVSLVRARRWRIRSGIVYFRQADPISHKVVGIADTSSLNNSWIKRANTNSFEFIESRTAYTLQSPCHLVQPTSDTSPGHVGPPSIALAFRSVESWIQLTSSTTSTDIVVATPTLTLLVKSTENFILAASHTNAVDHVHSIHTDASTMSDMVEWICWTFVTDTIYCHTFWITYTSFSLFVPNLCWQTFFTDTLI